jgi:SPW repeat
MATPLARRPEPGDEFSPITSAGPAAVEYLFPRTGRGIAAQAVAALGLLTGLWVALSPLFITLQHGGTNANVADVIAGLTAAGLGAFALASPRGFPGLQFGTALLGVWVIISSFILDAKFTIATPMYWSNSFSGAVLVVLALAGLAAVRPIAAG